MCMHVDLVIFKNSDLVLSIFTRKLNQRFSRKVLTINFPLQSTIFTTNNGFLSNVSSFGVYFFFLKHTYASLPCPKFEFLFKECTAEMSDFGDKNTSI